MLYVVARADYRLSRPTFVIQCEITLLVGSVAVIAAYILLLVVTPGPPAGHSISVPPGW